MSKVKRIIAMLLVTALMVPAVAVNAATPSVTKAKIDAANVSVKNYTQVVYNGKKQNVDVTVTVNGKELKYGTDYVTYGTGKKNAGVHTLNVKVVGKGLYEGTVTKTVVLRISKKSQNVKQPKTKKLKYSKLKKKARVFKIKVKCTGPGKIVYKSLHKKIKVSKKGKVIVAKGIAKGVYFVRIKALGTKNYSRSKTKLIKIVVK